MMAVSAGGASEVRLPGKVPNASLVIPSRGRSTLLRATVESILQGDQVPAELIVVDQSDTPDPALSTLTTERACRFRYLWTPIAGVSRARNTGIAAAEHEILVFTDDDVAVTPSWFGELVRALLRAGPRAAVSGQVLPGPAQTRGGFVPSTKVDKNAAVYEGRVGKDVLFSNNMAMFRSAIDEVGNFDERLGPGAPFLAAEDNDLGFRLLEAGYRIFYVPEAVLYHLAWRTERDYLPLRWSYGYGQGAYYAKHLSLTDRYMLWRMVRHIRGHAREFAREALHRRRFASDHAVYVLGMVSGATKWVLTQLMVRRFFDGTRRDATAPAHRQPS